MLEVKEEEQHKDETVKLTEEVLDSKGMGCDAGERKDFRGGN